MFCIEGMELNNVLMVCEFCEFGYYKGVFVNDIRFSVGERFWCLKCFFNRIICVVGIKDIVGCIGIYFLCFYFL